MKIFSDEKLAELRRRLPEYLTARGFDLRRSGTRYKTRCPFHEDKHPSFDVFPVDGGEYRCGCYPCDFNADVFDIAKRLGEVGTFPELVEHVARTLGEPAPERDAERPRKRIVAKPQPYVVPPPPGEKFEDFASAVRAELWHSDALLEMVAAEFSVRIDTVRNLCYTSDALGWDAERERLLYLYEHGAKLRNPAGTEPRFQWIFGSARAPWRWHFAARPEVKHVYLTEGESDAVVLIDAGFEELYPKDGSPASAVVASPGTSFNELWASLFEKKRVTLVFDWDEAGRRAVERVAALLEPHAEAVLVAGGKAAA